MKFITIKKSSKKIPVGKIVCVGRNYAEHARELGNEVPEKPVIFLKPTSALIYNNDKVIHPDFSEDMHHEAELVLLIGKKVKNANASEAEEAITGYGVGLDMTLRDVQNKLRKEGNPWTVAKGFDTSAVISDIMLKKNYKLTLDEEISLSTNGTIKQKAKLNTMILNPVEIVEYISSLMALEEGDLIYTGTPSGVSKVSHGDKMHAEIEGIASLDCSVE